MNELRKNNSFNKERGHFLEDIARSAKLQYSESATRLEELAQSVNAGGLFTAVVANLALGSAEQVNEITHGTVPAKLELLAFHIFPFLDVSGETNVTPWHTKDCIDELEKLHQARIQNIRYSKAEKKEQFTQVDSLVEKLRFNAEIVRGSAYPEQTSGEISSVQGRHEKWFSERVGIGPSKAQESLWAIIKCIEKNANDFFKKVYDNGLEFEDRWVKAKHKRSKDRTSEDNQFLKIFEKKKDARGFGAIAALNAIAAGKLPVSRADIIAGGCDVTDKEWSSLCDLIGLTKKNREFMTSPIEVRQRPLFVLQDNRVILVDISNALDVLWERFDEVARSDRSFYDRKYQTTKAKWLESEVASCLLKIFPEKHIYRNLSYPNPDKEDSSTAEIDVVILWGPFLILVESKSKTV